MTTYLKSCGPGAHRVRRRVTWVVCHQPGGQGSAAQARRTESLTHLAANWQQIPKSRLIRASGDAAHLALTQNVCLWQRRSRETPSETRPVSRTRSPSSARPGTAKGMSFEQSGFVVSASAPNLGVVSDGRRVAGAGPGAPRLSVRSDHDATHPDRGVVRLATAACHCPPSVRGDRPSRSTTACRTASSPCEQPRESRRRLP